MAERRAEVGDGGGERIEAEIEAATKQIETALFLDNRLQMKTEQKFRSKGSEQS
jgi:hypothetical protein